MTSTWRLEREREREREIWKRKEKHVEKKNVRD